MNEVMQRQVREAAESLAIRICSCATTSQHRADVAAVLAFREECLTTAQSEIEALREEVERLTAELARRDANENRNCINWGPCSRHDRPMTEPDHD